MSDEGENNNKRKSVNTCENERDVKASKGSSATSVGDSITDAAAYLHSLLQSKEKELKEREADFSRRVTIFESQNPTLGKNTDVLQLNVGGKTNIAVLRGTLTMFEDSLLAVKFSGRWDDSMEKDRDGNFFVDQDPEHFVALVNYLRLRMNVHPRKIPIYNLPKPSYEFCSMLEYYNLMPGVYPQNWCGENHMFTCEEISYGTVELTSVKNDSGGGDSDSEDEETVTYTAIHDFGWFKKSGLSEFTVVFEKGAAGAVGWLDLRDQGIETANIYALRNTLFNSIYLNITERKIYGPDSVLEENMMIDSIESATEIICRHNGNGKYSVELVGVSPPDGVSVTLKQSRRADHTDFRVFPMISFAGKVTVSGLKYAIDEWQD